MNNLFKMKQLAFALISTFIIITFSSCDNETATTLIEGSVTDYYSNDRISNVVLKVYEKTNDLYAYAPSTYYSYNYGYNHLIDSVVVGLDGEFTLLLDNLMELKEYNISLFNDTLISSSLNSIEPGKINIKEISVKKYKILRLNIKKATENSLVYLQVKTDNKLSIWYSLNLNDTVIHTKVIPDSECRIKWTYPLQIVGGAFLSDSLFIQIQNVDTSYVEVIL